MTLSTISNKVSYSFSSTSITAFTIPFFFIENADISAILRDSTDAETTWTLTTDYTVSGAGDESGGTLTAINPLSAGDTLVIKRVEQFTQPSDLPTAGPLPSGTLEEGLDRLTMLAQQLNEVDSRVPQLAATSTYSNLTLPDPEADKLIGWNSDGTDLQNIGAVDVSLTTVSAYMATVLDDTSATAALTTLTAAGSGAANIFSKSQTWSKGTDIASPADGSLELGTDGNTFDITGTNAITSIGTVAVGTWIKLHFDAALTLTHHATDLILPGAANIITAAGDEAEFVEYASGDWRCTSYTQAGARNYQDRVLQRPEIKDYGETVNALGDLGGGTDDIDITLGNVVTATVSTSTQTFTFSNPPASGTGGSFTLILTNGGSQTVNWPASVDWAGGTAQTLTTTGVDILTFVTVDGGTTWHGMVASADSK